MLAPDDAILVAVGSDGAPAAVRFAAEEARLTRHPLHLVHVCPTTAPGAALDARHPATVVLPLPLARATATAHRLFREVPQTSELISGGRVVEDLLERAGRGRMLVLEHQRLSRMHRLVSGSTVNGVASRAAVPVVSVPAGYVPAGRAVVTAAVQDAREASTILALAFREAELRGARVVVVHAWWLATGYDLEVVDQQTREEFRTRTLAALGPLVECHRAAHPAVESELLVRHAPPTRALLEASSTSDLLVIGRRHHRPRHDSHLGPVARAVLDFCDCPVIVCPEAAGEFPGTPDLADSRA